MTRSALRHAQEKARPVAPDVAVIIVGYRNEADIVGCLRALSRIRSGPSFHIFIAENGGPDAFNALRDALTGAESPCRSPRSGRNVTYPLPIPEATLFSLPRAASRNPALVHVALMPENLGYAGAINAWLRRLLEQPGWRAAWILNPDTEPTPTALSELADYADRHRKGMVAGRIISTALPEEAHLCGLRWCKLTSRTVSVNHPATAIFFGAPSGVESLMDAPDGASIYVTRDLIDRIGLMDERYFLYYEDLEWGCRAKALGELGYANRARVPHKGGTTIGSAASRAARAPLAVYMEFRNRILFVRRRYPTWLTWTLLLQLAHIATYVLAGSATNTKAASRGLLAGLRGETGHPGAFLRSREVPNSRLHRADVVRKLIGRVLLSIGSPRATAQ